MDWGHYVLVGGLALLLVLLSGFGINPLAGWAELLRYFSRGLDEPKMRSRIDRQRDWVLLAVFLAVLVLPASILLWFLRAR